ncbi:hypothetical protein P910_001522 [Xylella fastidiosa Mul-MD]|uniref:AAA family ATPase n=3 Tax=Xylella fastidiosa TaxID=2371 RepID=UPI0003ED0FBF|nr:AAA family ATPase [Xylella fastidiosa]EWG15223.1 hypothetical protein P910_001522 [Xylella fastidiosa Mul-MD]
MLKKLIKVNHVGLLRNGVPPTTPTPFGPVTLFYAENGRGKTTVANILRAVTHGEGKDEVLQKARTIDADESPCIELLWNDGKTDKNLTLHHGHWTGTPPDILIFDVTFVDDNVYSGQQVHPEQRQKCLQFVLGAESVKLEREIDKLTNEIADENTNIKQIVQRIQAYSKNMPIADFIKLAPVTDAEAKIAALRTQREAARNVPALLQRHAPQPLPHIECNIDAFFSIIQSTFHDIRADAEEIVQAHFQRHQQPPGIEAWVMQGREFNPEQGCPFCGQEVTATALIKAYETYFNTAFKAFMKNVATLGPGVETRFPEAWLEKIADRIQGNDACVAAWKDQLDLSSPFFDNPRAIATFTRLRTVGLALAQSKQHRPLDCVGTTQDKADMVRLLEELRAQIDAYNAAVDKINRRITDFKQTLAESTPVALEASIATLEIGIVRQSTEVVQAITAYQAAKAKKEQLEREKKNVRAALDARLPELLSVYASKINQFLRDFGAAFLIDELKQGMQGGVMRANYRLQLRGQQVALGNRTDPHPGFHSVLSEGDKRTLALAFFLARLYVTPDALVGKSVVLDDPMCSFDTTRRNRTMESIAALVKQGVQVVVLSHDAYFLRDLRDLLAGPRYNKVSVNVHHIKRTEKDYSQIVSDVDLDSICQSDYMRRYAMVVAFVSGTYEGTLQEVASALRPLVEGFLKHRFAPPLLRQDLSLGQMISAIRKATHDSPLVLAKPYVDTLEKLNAFLVQSHHDDSKSFSPINDGQLRQYAQIALELIYGGSLPH